MIVLIDNFTAINDFSGAQCYVSPSLPLITAEISMRLLSSKLIANKPYF